LAGNIARRQLKGPAPIPAAPFRTVVAVPPDRSLDSFAVSPDGNTVAYAADAPDGRLHLFLRRADGSTDTEVSEAVGAHDPFFSPDGRFLAYFSHDAIWRVAVSGGPALRVCDAPGDSAGGAWTDEGRI